MNVSTHTFDIPLCFWYTPINEFAIFAYSFGLLLKHNEADRMFCVYQCFLSFYVAKPLTNLTNESRLSVSGSFCGIIRMFHVLLL